MDQTGGGSSDPGLSLSALEERVAGLIGPTSISGVPGGVDTDAPVSELENGKNDCTIKKLKLHSCFNIQHKLNSVIKSCFY